MNPGIKKMMARKYMEENRDRDEMRDRRYDTQMRGPRYDEDMRDKYSERDHHEEWPGMTYNHRVEYPDTEPAMRRGRSTRTGRYISAEYNNRMGEDMRQGRPIYDTYDYMPGYDYDYRRTDMGFMPEDRYPWPMNPSMKRDAYDFSVSGSIADMGYGHADGKFVPMLLKMTRKVAEEWTDDMQNADGSQGPRWSYEEVKKVMDEKHIECDPNEMYAILNSVYSDYYPVAKKFGVDKLDFYLDLAKAWIDDKDAVPNKATMYYKYVVKH